MVVTKIWRVCVKGPLDLVSWGELSTPSCHIKSDVDGVGCRAYVIDFHPVPICVSLMNVRNTLHPHLDANLPIAIRWVPVGKDGTPILEKGKVVEPTVNLWIYVFDGVEEVGGVEDGDAVGHLDTGIIRGWRWIGAGHETIGVAYDGVSRDDYQAAEGTFSYMWC